MVLFSFCNRFSEIVTMPLSSQEGEGEYVEESLDDWAGMNFSQMSDSRFDDDSLLKPLR